MSHLAVLNSLGPLAKEPDLSKRFMRTGGCLPDRVGCLAREA